ncbi:FAD/NAD(P)-binding protein [Streptomyces sp. NPDC001985]|uniref:FAD/NAD(P)-binding protein n=1 Tax=Streptomyces sp. NPDC001985 TaxID=3154406 RepID=UPI00332EEC42
MSPSHPDRAHPEPRPARPALAVVGAGAAGALTTLQLCTTAARRRVPLDLWLVDPAGEAGRGTAYAVQDPRCLLNVPAGNMSCYPDDPGHFVRWLCRHGDPSVTAADFVARHRYGSYLADTLGQAIMSAHGTVTVRRLRTTATGISWPAGHPAEVRLSDGGTLNADGVVLATGPTAGTSGWAPAGLRASERFIARPWEPGALDAVRDDEDVLLVGTGLTAVDLAVLLDRPHRVVFAVSRHGLLPQRHALTPLPPLAPPTGLAGLPLGRLRTAVRRHLLASQRAHGDWRPALDGLRPVTSLLWQGLDDEERAAFLGSDAAWWNTHRHRMAPAGAETIDRALAARRLRVSAGRVASARDAGDGRLTVSLTDGRTVRVGRVVDCTGPGLRADDPSDPLWHGLVADGLAVPGPLGMGVVTDAGRLRDSGGRTNRPLYTLGSARRGEAWETTAIPEIRVQAEEVALALLAPLTLRTRAPRRRPSDQFGLALSTHKAAAAAYRQALHRIVTVRGGAEAALNRAVELDPGFALAHAALALLGQECGADVDVPQALALAGRSVRERGDERERSFVEALTRRVRAADDRPLVAHLGRFPRDALALGMAVPTIAFSGVGDLEEGLAGRLLDTTAPAHGDHWFHLSLRAFIRQEQGGYEEAGELARRALAAQPDSGHAAHALAHVHYESGRHGPGRDWLDGWIAGRGRGAVHRAHFSWHAALHELALDDPGAVRRRWFAQLAPDRVHGVRALVDSGSLLWRARMARSWTGPLPAADVRSAVACAELESPATPFTALHSAVALAACADLPALRRLRTHAQRADPVQREVVAPLCEALAAVLEERWTAAARTLREVLPVLYRVGGSAAQREIVEETLLYVLVEAGHCDGARRLLERRLDRRAYPLDRRRLAGLPGTAESAA